MFLCQWSFYRPSLLGFFCIAAPFPVLSLLPILFDKCQMMSFEDFNQSKTFFFEKRLFLKKLLFEKRMFVKKNAYLKQKKIFLKKKTNL